MKNILIPTDYQTSSLDAIHNVCRQLKGEEMNLIFVHVFKLSDSFSDVITLSRRSREYEKVSDDFYRYCNVLRAQYPQIKNIKIEFLYGSTLGMFKNFIEANEVDMVLGTQGYTFNHIHAYSVDPALLIQRSGLPVISTPKADYGTMMREPKATAFLFEREEMLTEV